MAYIKVNHSEIGKAAKAVDDYVQFLSKKMLAADAEVVRLSMAWEGSDFKSFKAQWNTVNDSDSTYGEMVKALKAYSSYLKYAQNKYKNAQVDAINRANRLPKW